MIRPIYVQLSLKYLLGNAEQSTGFAHLLLVDPSGLGRGPGDDLLRLEPESDLLLGVLDAVGAVADVASDIDGVVACTGCQLLWSMTRNGVLGVSYRGWCQGRKPMGWWHRGELKFVS